MMDGVVALAGKNNKRIGGAANWLYCIRLIVFGVLINLKQLLAYKSKEL